MQPTHTFADNGTLQRHAHGDRGRADRQHTVLGGGRQRGAVGRRRCERQRARSGSVVTFVGTATDPSSVDQATLEYSWDFGDGSPTATAAAGTTTHVVPDAGHLRRHADGVRQGRWLQRRRSVASRSPRSSSVSPRCSSYFGDFIGRTGSNSDMRAILVDRNAATRWRGARSPSPSVARRCPRPPTPEASRDDVEGHGRARAVRGERHVASGEHGRPAVRGFVDDAPVPGAAAVEASRREIRDGLPPLAPARRRHACEDRGDDRLRRCAVVRLRARATRRVGRAARPRVRRHVDQPQGVRRHAAAREPGARGDRAARQRARSPRPRC